MFAGIRARNCNSAKLSLSPGYPTHLIPPAPSFVAGWRDLQCRQLLVSLIALTYIPCMIIISLVLDSISYRLVHPALPAVAWTVAFAAAAFYRSRFRCPRCHARFFRHDKFARACAHCGLPQWAAAERECSEGHEKT